MGSIFLYYMSRFTRNLQYLKYEVRDGEEKRNEVQEYIYEAKRRGNYNDKMTQVDKWIQNLKNILDEAKKILDESCYHYSFASTPNIISRYRLSKKAEKAAQEIAKYLDGDEAYSLFRLVSFSTKMVATKDILKVLEDEQVNMIGLYGITSDRMRVEVTKLVESAYERQLYRQIAILVMSRNYNLLEIQGELAAKIGLQLTSNVIENAVIENARLINERLTKNMQEVVSELWLTFKDATQEWWQENEGEDSIAKELVQDCEALTYGPALQMPLFQHGGITTPTPDAESGFQVAGMFHAMEEKEKIMSDLAREVKRRCRNKLE